MINKSDSHYQGAEGEEEANHVVWFLVFMNGSVSVFAALGNKSRSNDRDGERRSHYRASHQTGNHDSQLARSATWSQDSGKEMTGAKHDGHSYGGELVREHWFRFMNRSDGWW